MCCMLLQFVIALCLLNVFAFTGSHRKLSYSYVINKHIDANINLDPIVTSLQHTIQEFCLYVYCEETQQVMLDDARSAFVNATAINVQTALAQYWRKFPTSSSSWLISADLLTQQKVDKSLKDIVESLSLWRPSLNINEDIATVQNLFNKKEYKLAAALSNYLLLHAPSYGHQVTSLLVLSSEVFRLIGRLEAATHLSTQV